MKAKYLIQIQTNNANMGAGWFTMHGAMTKAAADDLAADFRNARAVDDLRAVRVISYANFSKEHRAANHAAMRAAQ